MSENEDAKQAWSQVGERFALLGERIAKHYKDSGDTDEQAAEETRKALERAAEQVVEVVQRSADTMGKTFKDKEAGEDLRQALNAFGDAITATGREVGGAIRGRKDDPNDPPPPPAATT